MKITVVKSILDANQKVSADNKTRFDQHSLLVINLMSSPGAGKTSLLERTIAGLASRLDIGVIEGDIQTSLDAERIERAGAAYTHQINTHGACHIDANMIAPIVAEMDLNALDLLVIENVGNLVCPAEFDLGEDLKLVLFSVTEGEDKPKKYPLMFRESELLLINKVDLLPHLDTDLELIHRHAREINPDIAIMDISCKTGQGLESFNNWLLNQVNQKKNPSTPDAS